MTEHAHRVVVRFGDCDPAGIVYFPTFFDWFHQAMESWFEACLGVPYVTCIRDRKLGFPAVTTEARFVAPCPLGDTVDVLLSVAEQGDRSLVLAYRVVGVDGRLRATGKTKIVVCDLSVPGALRSIPMPEDLRAAMATWTTGPA